MAREGAKKKKSTGKKKPAAKTAKAKSDKLAGQTAAAKYAKVSTRTIRNWQKAGAVLRLEGGDYSKTLINNFRAQIQAQIQAKISGDSTEPIPATAGNERDRQRVLMAKKRAAVRDIEIPPVKNPARRARCADDPERFCKEYFPEIFYNPFTADQRTMINAIAGRMRTGGYQAIAATRGDGKTNIARVVGGVWGFCYGLIHWLNLLGANATEAASAIEDIKTHYEFNDKLAEDFPEVCIPIRALEGAAQRGGSQTVNGKRTRIKWGMMEIIFPHVEGSKASGGIITARGVDAAIRGLVRSGKRPDLNIADDIETRQSVRSTVQTDAIESTLVNDVLGLAGPGERLAVVYLCTIMRAGCLADRYTDIKINPAWNGLRHRFLITEPDNAKLWTRYIEMRQADQLAGDKLARGAHEFYLANRKKMDAGAKVNNPHRFINKPVDAKKKKPGEKDMQEVSALQHAYNIIADNRRDFFDTEYQNCPKTEVVETAGLEPHAIQRKLNGVPKGVVPADCRRLTGYVDVGRRLLHFTVIAWGEGAKGAVVDYGTIEVHSPVGSLKEREIAQAQEQAILTALLVFRDSVESGFAAADGGENRMIDLCLVDARWMSTPVHKFCAMSAKGVFKPSCGFGINSPQGRYRRPSKAKLPGGSHWHATLRPETRSLRFDLDVDYYKQRVHDGFLTPADQNGSITLYGDDPVRHRGFSEQILAEVWTRDFVPGKGWKEGWIVRHRANHFLDCAAGNIAAAEMAGIYLVSAQPTAAAQPKQSTRARYRKGGGFLDDLPDL